MNIILKIILSIALVFSFLTVHSQSNSLVVHTDRNGLTYNWQLSNQACYGCGSFYLAILRDNIPDEKGVYKLYVYFWSNSFYANGLKASTYITNINIYAVDAQGNKKLLLQPFWFLVKPKTDSFDGYNLIATISTTDPQQIISITYEGAQAF